MSQPSDIGNLQQASLSHSHHSQFLIDTQSQAASVKVTPKTLRLATHNFFGQLPEPEALDSSAVTWLTIGLCLAGLGIGALLIIMYRHHIYQAQLFKKNEERYRDLARLGSDLFWELDNNLKISYLSGDFHYLHHAHLKGKNLCQILASIPNLEADWEQFNNQ